MRWCVVCRNVLKHWLPLIYKCWKIPRGKTPSNLKAFSPRSRYSLCSQNCVPPSVFIRWNFSDGGARSPSPYKATLASDSNFSENVLHQSIVGNFHVPKLVASQSGVCLLLLLVQRATVTILDPHSQPQVEGGEHGTTGERILALPLIDSRTDDDVINPLEFGYLRVLLEIFIGRVVRVSALRGRVRVVWMTFFFWMTFSRLFVRKLVLVVLLILIGST